MLTQTMPAVIDALRSVLSPGELQNLTQALGNCQQPLTHRGSMNFAPGGPPQKGGVYTHNPWDPQRTPLPSAANHGNVDIPGMQAGWNNGNSYNSQFFFPTDQYFAQNQFFGGPQHYVQNHAHIEYLTNETFEGNNVTTNNITVNETINGEPVAGIPGAAGGEGREGRPGAPGFPGFPGRDGAVPRGQFQELRYLAGRRPRIDFQNERVIQAPLRYVAEPYVRELLTVHAHTGAISGGTADFTVPPAEFTVVTGVSGNLSVSPSAFTVMTTATFDPDTCAVNVGTTTIYGFTTSPSITVTTGTTTLHGFTSPPAITFTGTEASYAAVSAITAAPVRASLFPGPAIGVLCRDPGRPLFAQAAEIVVCRDPVLKGVIPSIARVFQE